MSVRLKPGPKPDPSVLRTASGRPSQSRAALDARDQRTVAAVLAGRGAEARGGLTLDQLQRSEAGTALGRAYLRGELSRAHLDAGEEVRRRLADARRAVGIHVATDRPEGGTPSDGSDADELGVTAGYVSWARNAIRRADEVRAAVRADLGDHRAAAAMRAVEVIVVDDREAPGMVDDLRAALRAVHTRVISGNCR